jgi:hypothetical protein
MREQYAGTGVQTLLASGDIVATGERTGDLGRGAAEYSINKKGGK